MNLEIRVIRNTAKKFISDIQKESLKASRRAINKCGLNLRNEVRKNLRSSGIHITDARKNKNGKLYNDQTEQTLRLVQTWMVGQRYKTENNKKAFNGFNDWSAFL